jgi:hypothetical protein
MRTLPSVSLLGRCSPALPTTSASTDWHWPHCCTTDKLQAGNNGHPDWPFFTNTALTANPCLHQLVRLCAGVAALAEHAGRSNRTAPAQPPWELRAYLRPDPLTICPLLPTVCTPVSRAALVPSISRPPHCQWLSPSLAFPCEQVWEDLCPSE